MKPLGQQQQPSDLSKAIRDALSVIANDNRSGAAEILRHAVDVYRLVQNETKDEDLDLQRSIELIDSASLALVQCQPMMSALIRLATAAVRSVRTASDVEGAIANAASIAAAFVEEAVAGAEQTAINAAKLIQTNSRVMTHSRSSTVLRALIQAHEDGRAFEVVATESRPLFEGRTLAQALADRNIPVTLIADAGAAQAMKNVDLVLTGADALTPSVVVNKIGTRMLALSARDLDRSAFVVCDTSKFVGMGEEDLKEKRSESSELWRNSAKGIRVDNRYFENTPLSYFSGVVNEGGVLSVEEAARLAEQCYVEESLLSVGRSVEDGTR